MFGDRHVIVGVTVTEETPYLSGLLAGVTAMTVNCELILDRGCVPPLRRLSYPFNLTDEPDAQSKEPRTYAAFQPAIGIRFLKLPDNPTPDHPPRRVYREHRRVLDTQTDDNKPLTYAGYCDHRQVRRVMREGMREDTRGWEEEIRRCGALKVLKAECEVRTGRTPDPSDTAKERSRP